MEIKILQLTKQPYKMVWNIAKNCYNEILPKFNIQQSKEFIEKLSKNGHDSVFEHLICTIKISECSRSFMAQLTRHRLCSFTIYSQHYADHSNFKYKELENYGNTPKYTRRRYIEFMNKSKEMYLFLKNFGIPKHIAREILPNATLTTINMTCNIRQLKHIISLRITPNNCPEIIEFSKLILLRMMEYLPEYFKKYTKYL